MCPFEAVIPQNEEVKDTRGIGQIHFVFPCMKLLHLIASSLVFTLLRRYAPVGARGFLGLSLFQKLFRILGEALFAASRTEIVFSPLILIYRGSLVFVYFHLAKRIN